jgi:hypothetical protein
MGDTVHSVTLTAELEARTFGHGDHVCWTFDTSEELHRAAVRFLADGAAQGEDLLYVADADDAALKTHLDDLDGVAELLASGQLQVVPVRSLYTPGGVLDADAQVERYRNRTDAALAAGRTGFRVAADATALVTEPQWRQDFLAYELAVDRYIAGSAMAAMCAYDTRAIGVHTAELACVHRERHLSAGGSDAGFALFTVGDRLALQGELDVSNRSSLRAALLAAAESTPGDVLVLDLSGLQFADVGATRDLLDLRKRLAPRSVLIEDPRGILTRVSDALGWTL